MFVFFILLGVFPLNILSRFDIDVIYTWVQQPNHSKYELIRQICPNSHGNNIQRFRDTGTLYHSIRSVLRYLPWIRHIFLVTNGERPCWLREMSKISFVSHEEIWPQTRRQSELPTFNSIPIESHLHRIKGLSEHFIYLNDDMFVGTYLPPSYFFNLVSGVPHVNVKDMFWLPYELLAEENFIWSRESSYSLNTTPGYILTQLYYPEGTTPRPFPGSYMGTHGPYMCTISLINKIQSLWPQYFRHLSAQRCRSATNTQPVYSGDTNSSQPMYRPPFWIYQWYQIVSNISLPIERNVSFLNMFQLPSSFYDSLLSSETVEFFILNDDYSINALKSDLELKQQQIFLEKYYGWNSLNDYLYLDTMKSRRFAQDEKLVDYAPCHLIKDQSYFTITQRRKYVIDERNNLRKIDFNLSDSFAVARQNKILNDLAEISREIDSWLLNATSTLHLDGYSQIKSAQQLVLKSFIFPQPLEVGHYSDDRDGLSSGPFSYEGMKNLQLQNHPSHASSLPRPQYIVEFPIKIFDGSKKIWRENCKILRQSDFARGFFSLVHNILPTHDEDNSIFNLANCLHLNYIRGTRSESSSVRNRKLALRDLYEWGILSSFPLRDMRRYELEFYSEVVENKTQVPVLVTSIPVSGISLSYPPPNWNEIVYNSSNYPIASVRTNESKYYWIDIWYLLPSLSQSHIANQYQSRRMAKRNQLKLDLLDLVDTRRMKRKETTIGSLFIGVLDSPTNNLVGTIWSAIDKLFHSDRYDGLCTKGNSPPAIICGINSKILLSRDQLLSSQQILDIILKFSVPMGK